MGSKLSLRHEVFWPPFLLVLGALGANFYSPSAFLEVVQSANTWMLDSFSTLYAVCGLFVLWVCVAVVLSPLGKTRIGGRHAEPMLSFRSWICVSICTSTAAGILFWGMAEPIFHLTQPPASLGLVPSSRPAAVFAMSTLYLHWSFTPAAFYALPSLMFALAFYNLGQPFSISSIVQPILGATWRRRLSLPIDVLALYTLILGMAASLATGILTVAGGVAHLTGWASSASLWIPIGVLIILSFIVSAVLGLDKGIKNLSLLNSAFFIAIVAYVFFWGVPTQVLQLSLSGLTEYASTFLGRSLFLEFADSDPWPKQWTVFYWAVWLAWTPVTAVFLGRIGRGYTVRQFLWVNLVIPAVFAIFWMSVFGGTALGLQESGALPLADTLKSRGAESLVYAVFDSLPLASVLIPIFVFLVCISYVTSADSNTVSMSAMSTRGLSVENCEVPAYLNVVWGLVVGTMSLVMLVHSGIEGIKALSYLGGFPALFLELGAACSLLVLAWGPAVRKAIAAFSVKARGRHRSKAIQN